MLRILYEDNLMIKGEKKRIQGHVCKVKADLLKLSHSFPYARSLLPCTSQCFKKKVKGFVTSMAKIALFCFFCLYYQALLILK